MVTAWRAYRMSRAIIGNNAFRVRQDSDDTAVVECRLPGKQVSLHATITAQGHLLVKLAGIGRADNGRVTTAAEQARIKKQLPAALKKLRIPFAGFAPATGSPES